MTFKLMNEFDVIFISYDEDNCEENWADLQDKVPWAQRVHGVKGSDAAHKAAAELSQTDMFVSVDADNIVDPSFFDLQLDLDNPKLKGKAISWAAQNIVNNLEYGNGGLKLWPKQYVLDMRTHEHADEDDARNQVDFCWEDSYIQMTNQYSTTHPNGSPRQAFRAGFREGVKMSLSQGGLVDPNHFKQAIWWGNYKRLITWCSVGADVENGLWAMYGARLGCHKTNLTDWDYINVRDFDYLNNMFETEVKPQFEQGEFYEIEEGSDRWQKCYKSSFIWDKAKLLDEIKILGHQLRKGLGLEVAELDIDQSKFYKAAYVNVPRMNKLFTEDELNQLRKINK
jgi:hypothetical protein